MIISKITPKNIINIFIVFFVVFLYISAPPSDFKKNTLVQIKEGSSLSQIANVLSDKKIIRSKIFFSTMVMLLNSEKSIHSGQYFFEKPPTIFSVLGRVIGGKFGVDIVAVTLPEGLTVYEMSNILSAKLKYFNKEDFVTKAKQKEGFLFPDTYNFYITASVDDVISALEKNFQMKISDLEGEIEKSGHTLKEIITMASIVEKEATADSRDDVANILWKRIETGYPLQVDAAFTYILGKESAELTMDDLKMNSPYNTYKNMGLTPTPISNPGLESILAALRPVPTPYLYFLTGKDGKMYYAKTLEGHVLNKKLHL